MGESSAIITPISNAVTVSNVSNSIETNTFSVTSTYYLLTQFQPYRHDRKVGVEE